MTNEEILIKSGNHRFFDQHDVLRLLNLARQDEREKMQGVEVPLNAGDYVINSKRQLKQIHSIEPRENDNLRYNFTDGSFGLKNEKHLGGLQCGNYTKIDASGCKYEEKTVKRGGITCEKCIEVLKSIKRVKL